MSIYIIDYVTNENKKLKSEFVFILPIFLKKNLWKRKHGLLVDF